MLFRLPIFTHVCMCVRVYECKRREREEIGQGFQFRGIETCDGRRGAAGAATTDEHLLLRKPHTACILFSCRSHDQPCFGIDFLPVWYKLQMRKNCTGYRWSRLFRVPLINPLLSLSLSLSLSLALCFSRSSPASLLCLSLRERLGDPP